MVEGGSIPRIIEENGVSAEDGKSEIVNKVWIVNKLSKFTEAKKEGLKLIKITKLKSISFCVISALWPRFKC